jgi:hypothetical protein
MERAREWPIGEKQPYERSNDQQRAAGCLALQKCSKSLLVGHRRIVSRATLSPASI